ncbi:hypothetical protein A2368_02695 [Candidatus Collierbacteria bacterium RIFOXYB1_FULL_49_13]|uniref:N-acetyltransferase domain-containing protein n=1 Tax=Candidatus Collierbacteria bacterium RIFOXYB1_FULL_49_13 TaxID=1817728 RepID=A0A1F5FIY6_9BACT|nr:MAG: hypothetical protein A2368_02695 [Candidatus Collierbacteria bacterium RIFOXYB1_FULL_49_13]
MNQQSNYAFLQKYQRLQLSVMFDDLIDLEFATIGFSKTDPSSFWNLALTDELLNEKQLDEIETKLTSLNRKTTIYFENRHDLANLVSLLVIRNYKKSFEDCWQFWDNGQIDTKHFESTKKVNTDKDLKIFIDTFNACYRKDDPQNPYGELGEYLRVTEDAWHRHHAANRLEYFLTYKGDRPVAVSTLTNYEDIGYISNVGSLMEVRGEGFGKAATHYCVDRSIRNGHTEHCLATEEGHYPNEFYKRIGFSIRFTALGYTQTASTN